MIAMKKACVVYVQGLRDEAGQVAGKLEESGYEVCLHEASTAEATAARDSDGQVSASLAKCMAGAELCVFLIDAEDQFDFIGVYANAAGVRIVAVMVGKAAAIGGVLDEVAGAAVTIGSKSLGMVLNGEEVWESPDGNRCEPRDIRRQKCQ